jgi:glycosyltransferase involved in cell wall biosynthesis
LTAVTPTVSIVISTRNRRDDVLRAIESALAQEYPSLEVLVYDDASTDGTAEAVSAEFPEVRLHASSERGGYLRWRNRGFRESRGAYVVSIDDDGYFADTETVSRIVELFDAYPQAAGIALPYVEPQSSRTQSRMPPTPVGTQLRNYIGCAHALRRDVVLQLGGYRELLVHQGEERDLSLRLLDAGWQIVLGDCPTIVHCYSPNREVSRISFYGYRNTLLFSGLNVPLPEAAVRLVVDSIQLLMYRFSWATLPSRVGAVLAGCWACLRYVGERRPVGRGTYRLYRRLPLHGPMPLAGGELPEPVLRKVRAAC